MGMSLSKNLQTGKAGEHLVCTDLILQGYNAFLADQGLPFDVVVEKDGILKRVQVKSTLSLKSAGDRKFVYVFNLRLGPHKTTHLGKLKEFDFIAFVALDTKKVAYLPVSAVKGKNEETIQIFYLKTRDVDYIGRAYSTGKRRCNNWGVYIEDYKDFKF